MKTIATITNPGLIISESPFRCVFPMIAHNDSILGGLVGHLGQIIASTLRKGDTVEIEGHFITEKTLGKVFIIEHMTLPEKAKKGRNLKVVA